ncbi:hypothetical protein CLAFUW4_03682 [Fulvia fulva]|uniref:Uncharacterized protein n=1 Tax=Passalora fulva TaxID=5499 RepID=A0A9Q8P4U3_PASFU|nr:uncharacterized protein CLAFUR5_03660 [Fulvia fulva]KAK4631327.1 hypothetical protein CLAFUR4_03670 [Fulvia fulva]KAK4632576.1 hypothetical protein CLAFUR0_03673 [Fulvia fulva]UJO13201.1 hypothetical protein CLAFUR5_03660 [Fulvia fulva]WPV10739.1 hypothetical protein CLAFUW4_03682 [Fulvia fulva]WPV26635.1 hypothetical protein CLAFUW7_03674 [Fulvia fulva]
MLSLNIIVLNLVTVMRTPDVLYLLLSGQSWTWRKLGANNTTSPSNDPFTLSPTPTISPLPSPTVTSRLSEASMLQKVSRELALNVAANKEAEATAKQLFGQKVEQKEATIVRMEVKVEGLQTELAQKKSDISNLLTLLAKRASYVAQRKQVIRSSGVELPKPLKGREFPGWDDFKDPAETVAALHQ